MMALVVLLFGSVAAQTVPVCEDVDTQACALLAARRPDYCGDKSLSLATCPRYCGHCPVVCYHCDVSVTDYNDCNTTRACAQNETCMIKQLRSTADGHHEYVMSCEAKEVCDGPGLAFPFGKRDVESRDVSVHCCHKDLCNYPEQITTTSTAAPVTGCSRDIAFMVDTSVRLPLHGSQTHATSALTSSLQLIHDIAAQLDIGPYDNLVSLATFDQSVHKQWDLDDHMNKHDLLHAISKVHQRLQFTSHADLQNAIQYLVSHVLDDHNGDRDSFPDDIIIITDERSALSNDLIKRSLQRKSRDVIVISVGSSAGTVGNLATDASHVIQVSSYTDLPSIGGHLFRLLCT